MKLSIEISSLCNHKCYFCTSNDTSSIIMSTDKFKKIIDDIEINKIYIQELILTPSEGEVFMDDEFLIKLEYASNCINIKSIAFHTNFTNVEENDIIKLKELQNKKSIQVLISEYGATVDEFLTLTKTNPRYKYFYKLQENKQLAIKHQLIHRIDYRGINYPFIYKKEDHPITYTGICSNQYSLRILVNGDVACCICSGSASNTDSDLIIGNIFQIPTIVYFLTHSKRKELYKMHINKQLPEYCKTCATFNSEKLICNLNVLRYLTKEK